ncbi:MAG TPA: TIGR02117 family protein [Mucilaginibacter sp.]|jgi:uncharacterized protein (TIGR02117 family)|nr:TIGR02117 family protein [Mucilaginibacter sp.]
MTIKKILRTVAWVILSTVLFISAWILAALAIPLITVNSHPVAGKDVTIFIQTNGDHTDVIVPIITSVKDWRNELSYQNTVSKGTAKKYVAVGWGDKGFYLNTPTWSQLKFSVAFKAAFALSTAAVHATFCDTPGVNNDCKPIMLKKEQYKKLVSYIDNTFKRNSVGHAINIETKANYDNEDAFYEAKRSYNLFYTCNTWANNALKSCGQKACLWTPTDMGIFYHYR